MRDAHRATTLLSERNLKEKNERVYGENVLVKITATSCNSGIYRNYCVL